MAGHPREAIETYEVDASTGALRNVGERLADGSEACHISVDPSGRCVLTANYGDHYVEVFPIGADATVGERSCIVQHYGLGAGQHAARSRPIPTPSTSTPPTASRSSATWGGQGVRVQV